MSTRQKFWIFMAVLWAMFTVACWAASAKDKAAEPDTGTAPRFTVAEEQRDTLVGLQGVFVIFEELSPEASRYGLTKQALQNDTELRLRRNGIRVLSEKEVLTTPGGPMLYINVNIKIIRVTPAQLDLVEREYPIFKVQLPKSWLV